MAPTSWNANFATKLAFDNFVQTNIDLHAAGTTALDLMAGQREARRGDHSATATTTSPGSRTADAAGTGNNTMAIKTGAGDDVVNVTAAGISPLARLRPHRQRQPLQREL